MTSFPGGGVLYNLDAFALTTPPDFGMEMPLFHPLMTGKCTSGVIWVFR